MPNSTYTKPIRIELDSTAALVLFEFLARSETSGALKIEDPSEEFVLGLVQGQLEKQLVEPFAANYSELLNRARARIREHVE